MNRVACARVMRSIILRSKTLRALDMLPHRKHVRFTGATSPVPQSHYCVPPGKGAEGVELVQNGRFAENHRGSELHIHVTGVEGE